MNCSCFRSDLIHRLQLPIFSLIYSSVPHQPSFQPVITLHSLPHISIPKSIPAFDFQPPREDKKTSLHPVITGFRCFHISSVFRRTHSATVYSYLKSHFVSNRRGYKCSRIVVDFKSQIRWEKKKIKLRSNKALFLLTGRPFSCPMATNLRFRSDRQ